VDVELGVELGVTELEVVDVDVELGVVELRDVEVDVEVPVFVEVTDGTVGCSVKMIGG
jgi:hypothetical protein